MKQIKKNKNKNKNKNKKQKKQKHLPPRDSLNTEKTDEFTSTCKIIF